MVLSSMCLKQPPILHGIQSSNSQTKHQEMALTAGVEESATPEEKLFLTSDIPLHSGSILPL